MDDMPPAPAHAKPARRDNLLWAVAVIAAFALYDIWGAWATVGDKSGFTHGTGWTLTVIVEVYGVCALVAWLAPAGPRSRRFAMWSAATMFVLSLIGQASSHLTARTEVPPAAVVVFVSVLPVITLALIAVLVHLRHLDRADAAQAAERARAEAAEAQRAAAEESELAAVRAALDAARAALDPVQAELETARSELARVTAKVGELERKMAAQRARNSPAKSRATSPRNRSGIARATKVPDDVDARAEALSVLAAEPGISGADLGLRVGKSKRWGQLFLRDLATAAPRGPDAGQETGP